MANELTTVYNALVQDIRAGWDLESDDYVYSQELDQPPEDLRYAVVALAPFEIERQTPETDTATSIEWAIVGRFPYSAKTGMTHLAFQIQQFHALKSRLTASAHYAGVGYAPRVSQFDPTQTEGLGEAVLEVAMVFTHKIDFRRGE